MRVRHMFCELLPVDPQAAALPSIQRKAMLDNPRSSYQPPTSA